MPSSKLGSLLGSRVWAGFLGSGGASNVAGTLTVDDPSMARRDAYPPLEP